MRGRNLYRAIVAAIFFLISYNSLPLVGYIPQYGEFFRSLPKIYWWIENAVRPLLPILVGLTLVYGLQPGRWARELGLDKPIIGALILSLIITSPLYVVPIIMDLPFSEDTWLDHLFGAGIWPLAEEINFRGYGFGQIYLYSGLGFWPAGILTSVLFGAGHMTNAALTGHDLSGQLANAGFIGVSALLLAWVYASWNRNLWVVFFLHALGNFWGSLFGLGSTAVDSSLFFGLLIATLAIAGLMTVYRNRLPYFSRLASSKV